METLGSQLSRYGAIASPFPAAASGKIFFVLATSNARFGDLSSEFPVDKDGVPRVYGTVAAAMLNCVASRGDIIYVMPGHTESLTSATTLQCNVAGVTIRGLGDGALRPTFTLSTTTAATIAVSAANVTIDNVIIDMTGVDAIVAGITPTATNFTLSNSFIITATATNQATLGILTTAAASRMKLINNEFIGSNDAGTAAAVRIVGGNEHVIKDNRFYGAYTTSLGAIDNATTACLRCQITGNFIQNATASSTVCMTFQATSTGVIANNRMQILSGTAPIVGAAMSWVGANYYAATIATAGTLI
jgi:hypothetical protein